jgi:hypothetical protein
MQLYVQDPETGGKILHPRVRQFLVDTVLCLWPVMPMRAKVWAFMNDGDLKDDCKFNNK